MWCRILSTILHISYIGSKFLKAALRRAHCNNVMIFPYICTCLGTTGGFGHILSLFLKGCGSFGSFLFIFLFFLFFPLLSFFIFLASRSDWLLLGSALLDMPLWMSRQNTFVSCTLVSSSYINYRFTVWKNILILMNDELLNGKSFGLLASEVLEYSWSWRDVTFCRLHKPVSDCLET